jgi:hypothetical protein
LENGELLKAVEEAGFEVMITSDQNLEYQQNLKNRKTALVVLRLQSLANAAKSIAGNCRLLWMQLRPRATYVEVPLPPKPVYKPL